MTLVWFTVEWSYASEAHRYMFLYAAQAVDGVRIIDATGKFVMPGTFSTSVN